MPRPSFTPVVVAEGNQSWDATINDDISDLANIVLTEPFPPAEFVDLAALNAAHDAADYEQCVAVAGGVLYLSDGAVWVPIGTQAAAVADIAGTASGTYVQAEVQALMDKIDELLAVLRASNQLAS